jgi:NAD(P)-dependent dehydrogenase (short-subunit alcohol dehydrogenase family)
MPQSLDSRCYLITGGAGAIGYGIAAAILEAKGCVALLDIDAKAAKANARELDPTGTSSIALTCDVTDPIAAATAVTMALEHFGRVDGAVNNAGIIKMNAAWDSSPQEWQAHFNVNVTGAYVISQAVGQHLRNNGGGAIVNVASNCGKVGYPNMAAYNASKAALISLTRSLSGEWAQHNINVNAVCPGGVDTPMLSQVADWLSPRLQISTEELLGDMGPAQLGRRIQPIEVGRVITFLLSDAAAIIRGQALSIDGGDTPY